MRATTIKTYDGRRIVIPNTDLFTNSVTVNTAFENRCQEYQLEISFEEDVQRVKTILLETLAELDGVLSQPPAEVLVIGLTKEASIRSNCTRSLAVVSNSGPRERGAALLPGFPSKLGFPYSSQPI